MTHFCKITGKVEPTPMCDECKAHHQRAIKSFHLRVAAAATKVGNKQMAKDATEMAARCGR